MPLHLNRRQFLQTSALGAAAAAAAARDAAAQVTPMSKLTLNDDGFVFPNLSDDLKKPDLRRYLESYCRPGLDTVAYCVGDMSWPTFYPTKVGVHYDVVRASANDDVKRYRIFRNVDNFASEPGGYFGSAIAILRELGKKVLASFRMNDAHFTTTDNPNVSPFWKQHADLALGPAYGYYGGCLDYAAETVRNHFAARVIEFAEQYPDIDGVDLDAMRSPFFFLPDKGKENAPLFTEMVRRIKSALADQAKRLNRPDYLLTINVPDTPELALECGLDVAAWDAEKLFHRVSVGTYQAYMTSPIEKWKAILTNGTPVFCYINCSPQSGQYLGLEDYRAAAANAYGRGADGIYLFNYPCLMELAMQVPSPADNVPMALPDIGSFGHADFTKVAQALDELGYPDVLLHKNKRFMFYFNNEAGHRHYAPRLTPIDRDGSALKAAFPCYEDYAAATRLTLRFKIENVARTEQFQVTLNGAPVNPAAQQILYAANGRDTRTHTITLMPYQLHEIAVAASSLKKGENQLEVKPLNLLPDLTTKVTLAEIELLVAYPQA